MSFVVVLNSDGVSTRHPVEQTRARDSARVTANPEVISSLVELVPTNALVVTELSMFIDRPETGFARDLTQDFKVSSMPQIGPRVQNRGLRASARQQVSP